MVQALPSLHVDGQLPSQVSPVSTMPLPQVAEQSLSLLALQPLGQQPSPLTQAVTCVCVHTALQVAAEPVIASVVQAFPSLQSVGQFRSQVSLPSTTPLPQVELQSESLLLLQPAGQQPSPLWQAVIATLLQTTLQFCGEPTIESAVHALPSLQSVGQLPSQVSPGWTTPSPQKPLQSESFAVVHPAGQQPSPLWQVVIAVFEHCAVQSALVPLIVSVVHALLSLQLAGQAPVPEAMPGSQLSPGSIRPLPQVAPASVEPVPPPGQPVAPRSTARERDRYSLLGRSIRSSTSVGHESSAGSAGRP